jgi:hypothetical protein
MTDDDDTKQGPIACARCFDGTCSAHQPQGSLRELGEILRMLWDDDDTGDV